MQTFICKFSNLLTKCTQSIWADIMLTVGEYLYKQTARDGATPQMDVTDMEVLEAQILHPNIESVSLPSQFIRIDGSVDISQMRTTVRLYTSNADGVRLSEKAFASATVCYEEAQSAPEHWQMTSHLVSSRANSLWDMATSTDDGQGKHRVSSFSQRVAYHLFANVVDYGTRYRGMQRVALLEDTLEASADITLENDRHGTWHTPPHWIDGAFQLAGFVMNSFGVHGDGKTSGSCRDFFYITPGWRHFSLLEPLKPGPDVTYRNFVCMFPSADQPGAFTGDIYLHRGKKLVGVCAGIKFKAVSRNLMSILFPRIEASNIRSRQTEGLSAKDNGTHQISESQSRTKTVPNKARTPQNSGSSVPESKQPGEDSFARLVAHIAPDSTTTPPAPVAGQANEDQNSRVTACLALISQETGLDLDDLTGEAAFTDLGVDSLMSLALSAKFRAELGIDVQASIFLECPTVQDLVNWLSK